jgi:hypothetical protein
MTRNRAAANLDPNGGLIPRGAVGSWAFVAATWIGGGLDAATVGNAIRALRAVDCRRREGVDGPRRCIAATYPGLRGERYWCERAAWPGLLARFGS